ncbi:unnamed protein product [Parnassius apollo]|uniref:Ribosomal RNA-processing protein 8 n=1 Tax=Parnassius apollo TaxID=110799 RepID=A0A8S3XDH1_PARAO|nr:unnamed protein product [Parnassius apollo]
MFTIPDWGEDIPKTNVNFVKDLKKKKKKNKKGGRSVKDTNSNSIKVKNQPTEHKKINNKNNETKHSTERPMANGHTTEKYKNNISKKKNKPAKKRKQPDLDVVAAKKKKMSVSEGMDVPNFDADKPDEMLLNVGKKKLNDQFNKDDSEELLFSTQESTYELSNKLNKFNNHTNKLPNGSANSNHTETKSKFNKKKELIKTLLEKENHRNHISVSGNRLRERMLERLKAAQFRYLNEKLYTSSGSEAQKLFQTDPVAFQTYHQGYQQQVKKWPVNPLDIIVKRIMKMPKTILVADMGCGEAALSKRVPHKVRSFDLVAATDNVEACDMAHTPLLSASVDVAVYCLALMGTDLTQYLVEANRVLKVGGHLLIAEVESRFDDVEAFVKEVQRLGFKLKELDKSHQVFFFMEFTKTQEPPVKKSKLPVLTLKPCLYKKR